MSQNDVHSSLSELKERETIPFKPELSHSQANGLSASSLAYLGDAVFELYVRSQQLIPARKINEYHRCVISYVRAEAQAEMAERLQPLLNECEKNIFRRARNSADGKPKRIPLATYQQASGLEAVLGYLYLTDPLRLMEILNHCGQPSSLLEKD